MKEKIFGELTTEMQTCTRNHHIHDRTTCLLDMSSTGYPLFDSIDRPINSIIDNMQYEHWHENTFTQAQSSPAYKWSI